MTNAKVEFIDETMNTHGVKCAMLSKAFDYYDDEEEPVFILKVGYSVEDYENFLNSIDFNYDSGYGGQQLYGKIWYKDGSWSERGEYDGSECWEFKTTPNVPERLK